MSTIPGPADDIRNAAGSGREGGRSGSPSSYGEAGAADEAIMPNSTPLLLLELADKRRR